MRETYSSGHVLRETYHSGSPHAIQSNRDCPRHESFIEFSISLWFCEFRRSYLEREMTLLWGVQMVVPLDNFSAQVRRSHSICIAGRPMAGWTYSRAVLGTSLLSSFLISCDSQTLGGSQSKTRSVSLWNRLARLHSKLRLHKDE